jgi:hypothetical protein
MSYCESDICVHSWSRGMSADRRKRRVNRRKTIQTVVNSWAPGMQVTSPRVQYSGTAVVLYVSPHRCQEAINNHCLFAEWSSSPDVCYDSRFYYGLYEGKSRRRGKG